VERKTEKSMTNGPKSGKDRNEPGGQVLNVVRHPVAANELDMIRQQVEEAIKPKSENLAISNSLYSVIRVLIRMD
jgi:hypothetical protein